MKPRASLPLYVASKKVCSLVHRGYLLSLFPVSVGYEYESCLDVVLWEKRTAMLQGYELDASNMGGWMLDKHHILDIQNGKDCSFLPCTCACV